MPTHEQTRWREISPYLDEALDLTEPARAAWLGELAQRAPSVAEAVQSLLAEREHLDREPLLNEACRIALPHAALAGQQLGAYTLESVLGHGGMGTVWLARRSDGRYEGRAAVKVLNAALLGRPAEQRFVREGSVLAKVRHPNIAQLIDAGVAASGQPYLVLEYVEGERIDRYADENNLDVKARVRLFLDVLAAVAHAHSHLVVHRDIKPSNIMVTRDGAVKLLDFGIAALLGPDDAGLTREIGPGLTPEYAAPEQLLEQEVTTATDVYALGLVLFLLLTGKHPLNPEERSIPELARATLDHDPPNPSQLAVTVTLGRTLRGDLDNIVAKALKKEPQERYQTAEAFAQDLRAYLAFQPISARADTVSYRVRKLVRRNRGAVAAGALTALVLIGATLVTTLQMVEAQRQRDEALYQTRRAEFQARFAYLIMSEVGSDGQPMTIRDLLRKGIEVLERNYGDDPRFVIEMLVNISGRFMNLGDTKGEHAALVKAEQLARQLADPERIAFVQCNTVETELGLGQPQRARERMRDGLQNLAKLTTAPPALEMNCGTARARLLWSEGKLSEAIAVAESVAHQLERRNETGKLGYRTIVSMLVVMLGNEGRAKEAGDWNQRLIAELERAGEVSDMAMVSARHNMALNLYETGEVRAALEVQRPLVEALAAREGIDNVPASLAHRLGLYAVHSDETDAGMVWIDRAVARAAQHNEHQTHVGALMSRARANLLLGRFERVLPDIEQAERLAQQIPGERQAWFRYSGLMRAQLQLARGEPAAALQRIDADLAEIGHPRTRTARRLATLITLKATAQLALGRHDDARMTAWHALVIAEANAPVADKSAVVAEALMTLAKAQRASGDAQNARNSATRAATVFANALGPQHSQTRAAIGLRDTLQ
jgi:tetratricopeptide (TPR) repeat protein